jgi:hypothetical protein
MDWLTPSGHKVKVVISYGHTQGCCELNEIDEFIELKMNALGKTSDHCFEEGTEGDYAAGLRDGIFRNKLTILINDAYVQGYNEGYASGLVTHLKLSKDGNMWCVLDGEDLQEGTAGFGETKLEAFVKYLEALGEEPEL